MIPFSIYKKYFENLPESTNRKWKYNDSKANESQFIQDMQSTKVGNVLKKYFIDIYKRVSKKHRINRDDIGCIGDKKDIALKLINIIEEEMDAFEKLPKTTRKLTEKIYNFIAEKNSN